MRNIFEVFTKRTNFFLLGIYVFLSFFLMAYNDPATIRGMRLVVLQVVGWANEVEDHISFWGNVEQENDKLRKQVLELSMSNQRLREALIENIRLRRLLQFERESQYNYIAAKVIGYGQEQTVRSLVLDVGRADSVQQNFPVVTDQGLVGKILVVEAHHSIAQILMDHNALVSSRLQRSREMGVVAWSGNLWLDLNYIPKDVKVEVGEMVVTSGLSRIYPAGIKIGIVGEINENEYELFKEIKVKPAVNFNRLEEVFIIKTPDSLRTELTDIE